MCDKSSKKKHGLFFVPGLGDKNRLVLIQESVVAYYVHDGSFLVLSGGFMEKLEKKCVLLVFSNFFWRRMWG